MFGDAVEDWPHLHGHATLREGRLEHAGAVRSGEDGFFEHPADLASVDVEGGHDFDVGGPPAANALVHQADWLFFVAGPVKFDALNQRTGAVSNSGNGDSDFSHGMRAIVRRPSYSRQRPRSELDCIMSDSRPQCEPPITLGPVVMRLALLIQGAPQSTDGAATALRFAQAATAAGHRIHRAFFHKDGVHIANRFREAAGRRNRSRRPVARVRTTPRYRVDGVRGGRRAPGRRRRGRGGTRRPRGCYLEGRLFRSPVWG